MEKLLRIQKYVDWCFCGYKVAKIWNYLSTDRCCGELRWRKIPNTDCCGKVLRGFNAAEQLLLLLLLWIAADGDML